MDLPARTSCWPTTIVAGMARPAGVPLLALGSVKLGQRDSATDKLKT